MVQVYTSKTSVSGGNAAPNASGMQIDNGATAQALQTAGQSVNDSAMIHADIHKEQLHTGAVAWTSNTLSDFQLKWQQKQIDSQKAVQGPATDYAKTQIEEFDNDAAELRKLAPNETSKKYLESQLTSLRNHIGSQAQQFQSHKFDAYNIQQFSTSIDNSAKIVATDPTQFDRQLAEQKAALDNSGLPEETRNKLLDQTRATLTTAGMRSTIENDPDKAVHILQSAIGKFEPGSNESHVTNAALKHGVDPTLLYKLVGTESSFKTDAKNPYSSAGGIGQFTDGTWDDFGNGGDRNNPAHAADASARYTKHVIKNVSGKVGRVLTEGETKLAYQYRGNAHKIIQADPNTPAEQILDANIIKANKLEGKTAGDIVKGADSLMSSAKSFAPRETHSMVANMTHDQMHSTYKQAEQAKKQNDAKHAEVYKIQQNNDIAQASDGIAPKNRLGAEHFAKMYPDHPEQARIALDSYNKSVDVGLTAHNMANQTPDEISHAIEAARPIEGSPTYANDKKHFEMLIEASQKRDKDIAADPGGYFSKNSIVVNKAQKDYQLETDPVQRNVKRDMYFASQKTAQEKAGVFQPKLISQSQEDAIVGKLTNLNGSDLTEAIKQLRVEYGNTYWPVISKQLAGNKLYPPSAMIIDNIDNPVYADQVAKVASVPLATLQNNLTKEQLETGLPDVVRKNMAPLNKSFPNAANGPQLIDGFRNTINKLTMAYIGQGMGASDAAEKASEVVFKHKYDFVENSNDSNITMRIPKDVNPDAVVAGASLYLSNIPHDVKLQPLDNLQLYRDSKDVEANTIDNVTKNGYWSTNSDETGLELYTVDDKGGRAPVRKADGTKINLTWDELSKQGLQKRTEDTKTRATVMRAVG